jgi:hypothetical protein
MSAAVISGARSLLRVKWSAPTLVAAAGTTIWLAYSLVGVAYFWWYMVVPLAAGGVLASAGLPKVARGGLLPAMIAVYMVGIWSLALPLYVGRARAEYTNMFVADFIKAHANPGDTIMLESIGMIGYVTNLRLFDEVGLVTPEVVRRRLAGAGWYADLATARRPTWLVVRREILEETAGFAGAGAPFRSPTERQALFSNYRLVWPDAEVDNMTCRVFLRNQ